MGKFRGCLPHPPRSQGCGAVPCPGRKTEGRTPTTEELPGLDLHTPSNGELFLTGCPIAPFAEQHSLRAGRKSSLSGLREWQRRKALVQASYPFLLSPSTTTL